MYFYEDLPFQSVSQEFFSLWLSWWTAQVEADGVGEFFESACTKSPVCLLLVVMHSKLCLSSQKLNLGKKPY